MTNLKIIFNRFTSVFTRDSLLASFLFFLVLSSWYILRPVRNEMAVANVDELPLLLAFGAFAMLLANPVYAWVASKSNLKKIITYCYSFLIYYFFFFHGEFLISEVLFGSEEFFIFGAIFILFL